MSIGLPLLGGMASLASYMAVFMKWEPGFIVFVRVFGLEN